MSNNIDIGILDAMDELTLKSGTRDPFELIDYLGFEIVNLYSSVIGYVARVKGKVWIGLNSNLTDLQKMFAAGHEVYHAIEHIPQGRLSTIHQDSAALFTFDKGIAKTEEEANIAAADLIIPTVDILNLTGYNTRTVQYFIELQKMLERKEKLEPVEYTKSGRRIHTDGYIRICKELDETLFEIAECNLCHTKQQIARILGYHIGIIDYKMKALELRGYDVPQVELPDTKKVFDFDRYRDY